MLDRGARGDAGVEPVRAQRHRDPGSGHGRRAPGGHRPAGHARVVGAARRPVGHPRAHRAGRPAQPLPRRSGRPSRRCPPAAHRIGGLPVPRLPDDELCVPQRRRYRAPDGLLLHGLLYRPRGEPPFPAVVLLHGGRRPRRGRRSRSSSSRWSPAGSPSSRPTCAAPPATAPRSPRWTTGTAGRARSPTSGPRWST